ncbi:MAG: DJ-1/PfpI family protein [Puniceicoccales bacterium]|jgi:4-methyl-5(b-hydroxyethyl)-thiazole monophosphate biosynthesis|nr:DJ-1/PfpI family protein [Puniceicoccales bacterium]
MKSALIFLFTDFEEIEAISAVDVLRRAGVCVVVASLTGEKIVVGAHKISCLADIVGIPDDHFDAIVIPGGAGVLQLRNDKKLLKFIHEQYDKGKLIAAICAAPILLHDLGILEKHQYTCHFSMISEMKNARLDEAVVRDGNVITGCGPAAGINFGLAIVEFLENMVSVSEIARGMMCDF